MNLEKALILDIEKGTLARFWFVRDFLASNRNKLTEHANELKVMLDNMSRREQIHTSDPVIESIYVLCNCEGNGCYSTWYINVDYRDELVVFLANKFNKIIGSQRELFMCYDCGTVARAMFMKLIDDFRGIETLTKQEIENIKSYKSDKGSISNWYNDVTTKCPAGKRMIMMASIGIGNVGHVWILDIIGNNNNSNLKVRIFQSAKWAYTLTDYIKTEYPKNGCYIDFDKFYADIYRINEMTSDFTETTDIIAKWFKFKFNVESFGERRKLLYCWIILPLTNQK